MLETECYQILRISEKASFEDIKRAYRRSVQLYHPDVRPWDKNSGERFKKIARAYRVLSDKQKQEKVKPPANRSIGSRFSFFRKSPEPRPLKPPVVNKDWNVLDMRTAELAERFWGTENIYVKREVVKVLRYKQAKEALMILAKALKSADSEVRRLAVQSIAYFRQPQVVYLIASLLTDQDIKVKYETIKALGVLRNDRAVAILKRLTASNSFFIREKALEALNYSGANFFKERTA